MTDIKLSHTVLVLPIPAALALILVLAVVARSTRSQAVPHEIRADGLPALSPSGDAGAASRLEAGLERAARIQSVAVEEHSSNAAEIGRNISEAAGGSAEIAANVSGVATTAQSTSAGAATTLESATRVGKTDATLEAMLGHFIVNPTEEKA